MNLDLDETKARFFVAGLACAFVLWCLWMAVRTEEGPP